MRTFAEVVAKGRISVQDRYDTLTARNDKRGLSQVETFELRRCEHALKELDALDKARARSAGKTPLQVVWLQMDELSQAGLKYDCLNLDDVVAVNAMAGR